MTKQYKYTEESKLRMRLAHLGKKMSKESIQKRLDKVVGIPHSQKWKDNISKSNIGHSVSEETRLKISQSVKSGLTQERLLKLSLSHKGKKRSLESIKKGSMKIIGIPRSEETKRKIGLAHKGKSNNRPNYHHSQETIEKIRKGNKGKVVSDETKNKLRLYVTGKRFLPIGFHHSEKTKNKLRDILIGKIYPERSKENHPNWRGGSSNEHYPCEWNRKLRDIVRERDGFLCQLCYVSQNGRKLAVHHIDYNKNNLSFNNLISLCHNCHTKTNFNREYYTEYFTNLLNSKEYTNASMGL